MLPRLYAIADAATLVSRRIGVIEAVETLLDAGVRLIQLRDKGHLSREGLDTAQRAADLCRSAGALLIIDDRADVALLAGAGLHVGQDDIPPADARRLLGPSPFIGFSTHNEQQLRAADREPVDYLAIGPVFETGSKRNPDPVLGLERLKTLRPLTAKPLVAIGGITRRNAPSVLESGIDSVALISDLFPDPCTPSALRHRAAEWLRTVGGVLL